MRYLTLSLVAMATSAFAHDTVIGSSPQWSARNVISTVIGSKENPMIKLWPVGQRPFSLGSGWNGRFSPDGSRFFYSSRSATVGSVLNVYDVSRRQLIGQFPAIADGQISVLSNDTYLAPRYMGLENGSAVFLCTLSGGAPESVIRFKDFNGVYDLEAYDDKPENWFITGSGDQMTNRFNACLWAGSGRWLLDACTGSILNPQYKRIAGRGEFLLYSQKPEWGNSRVVVLNLQTLSKKTFPGISGCFSPDGHQLAISQANFSGIVEMIPFPDEDEL